jgi:hypothetical protein
LTNGRQQGSEVARAYRSMGYSVPGVSDYHSIAAQHGVPTLPLYEHGYSLLKRHQLAIGARRVDWFDFPLWQATSHQQYVIERVADTADLVALAHPSSRDAYTPDDLRRLTGYHLIEVVNGPFLSLTGWDAALSAGRLVWAVGNDDTHDLRDPRRTAQAWTMINAPSSSTSDIVSALSTGRSYVVRRTNESASAVETVLDRVTFADSTLTVSVAGDPSTFVFTGQDGEVKHTVQQAMHASYVFRDDDTYIRTAIHAPRTAMLLNPVFRSRRPGGDPAPAAVLDVASTWTLRAGLAAVFFALIALFAFRHRRPRVRACSPSSMLAPADRDPA